MCRKTLTGDESSAITIDFLRARLLAERASSKAAKERILQLTKKVIIRCEQFRGRIIEHTLRVTSAGIGNLDLRMCKRSWNYRNADDRCCRTYSHIALLHRELLIKFAE